MEYTSFNNCRRRYAALMWNNERMNDRPKKKQQQPKTYRMFNKITTHRNIVKYKFFSSPNTYDMDFKPVTKIYFSPKWLHISSALRLKVLMGGMGNEANLKIFLLNLTRTKMHQQRQHQYDLKFQ